MNIIEAYLMFNKKLIIILSGLSGSGKTSIAKLIERDFKLLLINIEHFVNKSYNQTEILPNGKKIINWDNVDSYDWDKINNMVVENQSKGVILCGPFFPTNKLNFICDFHIQIKIQKQILIENRIKYLKKNEIIEDDKNKIVEDDVQTIVNKITYPLFLKYSEESKIDKYINSKDLTQDQMYDQIADFLFFRINEYLKNQSDKKTKSHQFDKQIKSKKSESSDTYDLDSSDCTDETTDNTDQFEKSDKVIKLGNNNDYDQVIGSEDNKEIWL